MHRAVVAQKSRDWRGGTLVCEFSERASTGSAIC